MVDLLEKAKEDRIAQEEYTFEHAFSKGKLEGKLEGKFEGKLDTVIDFIKELQLSVTKAMQVSGLPDDFRDELICQLEKNNIPYTL